MIGQSYLTPVRGSHGFWNFVSEHTFLKDMPDAIILVKKKILQRLSRSRLDWTWDGNSGAAASLEHNCQLQQSLRRHTRDRETT